MQKSFLQGAMVLALAGLISKLLGILYRIPFTRMVGAEGMGLYQMAYPIYTIVLALATAGFPVAISVLVSEKQAQRDPVGMRRVFRLSLWLLTIIGLLLSVALYQSAGFLAENLLHDSRAEYALKVISPAIFFAAVMSVFRGYFQGQQTMAPTALSQVFEQIIRVGTVLFAAWWLLPLGLEYAAAGATFGAVSGGIAGLGILLFIYFQFTLNGRGLNWTPLVHTEGSISILKRLMRLAFPIALGALVMPIVQTLDAFLVPLRLQAAGYTTQQATELFGQLSGMAGTLVNLPGVITSALATSLVPAISGLAAQGRWDQVMNRLTTGLRGGIFITLPAALGFFLLAEPICALLYAIPEAGLPLKALAPAVFFLGVYQVTSAALQGLGRTGLPMVNLILAGLLKIVLNYILVAHPVFGIQGAALATGAAFALAAGLNLIQLRMILGYTSPWGKLLLKPGIAVTIMAICVHQLAGPDLLTRPHSSWLTLGIVGVAGLAYAVSLLALGGVKSREIEMLPGIGPALANILRQLKLVRN